MTQYRVKKTAFKGQVLIPSSKSHTLRAILFGTLAHGKSRIQHPLLSNDTSAMIEACRLFGAHIEFSAHHIDIEGLRGKILQTEDVIHAGNSGIVLRFCSAVGALAKNPIVVTGDISIRHQRPMKQLLSGLSQLGVSALSMRDDYYAPVIIRGPLQSGKATISGEDSQPVSALLIAASLADGPIEINVHNPGEKPWVGLTLDWFDRLAIPYENHHFEHYRLSGNAQFEGFNYQVPGDFSSAAFPLAAALITNSELTLKNVDMQDPQGDKELVTIFQKMGASIEIDEKNKTIHVKKGSRLSAIKVDINNFVDALPILTVVACYAEGETEIYNASVAREKECNRIHCIATELKKMGAHISETADGLHIKGSKLKGAHVESHHDHRMAMSLAVAAMGAEDETLISSVECVSKTFPTFAQDFKTLGVHIEEIQ